MDRNGNHFQEKKQPFLLGEIILEWFILLTFLILAIVPFACAFGLVYIFWMALN